MRCRTCWRAPLPVVMPSRGWLGEPPARAPKRRAGFHSVWGSKRRTCFPSVRTGKTVSLRISSTRPFPLRLPLPPLNLSSAASASSLPTSLPSPVGLSNLSSIVSPYPRLSSLSPIFFGSSPCKSPPYSPLWSIHSHCPSNHCDQVPTPLLKKLHIYPYWSLLFLLLSKSLIETPPLFLFSFSVNKNLSFYILYLDISLLISLSGYALFSIFLPLWIVDLSLHYNNNSFNIEHIYPFFLSNTITWACWLFTFFVSLFVGEFQCVCVMKMTGIS